jgi:hypothetical protein
MTVVILGNNWLLIRALYNFIDNQTAIAAGKNKMIRIKFK